MNATKRPPQVEASPRPWLAQIDPLPKHRNSQCSWCALVSTGRGNMSICCTGSGDSREEDAANAALIVAAVNSHEALVEACKAMVAQFADAYRDPCDVEALDKARAALKLATGKKHVSVS